MSKVILVTGATGKQGSAVINFLLSSSSASNITILALTRDPTSPSAQRLSQNPKIKIIRGDLDNPAEIFTAARDAVEQPIWGVFSVQLALPNPNEEKQGKSLIDASLQNNVQHFVYSSVDRGGDASYDNPTDIPHFITKHNIEHHLVEKSRGTGMTWTILRPVAFYDNLVPGFVGKIFSTAWKTALKGKGLQCVAVSDIGFFAAEALVRPEEWAGRVLSIAGEEVRFEEVERTFKEVTGEKVGTTWVLVTRVVLWMVKELGYMFRWFHDVGFGADIEEVRRLHPGLKDFRTWLETESAWRTK